MASWHNCCLCPWFCCSCSDALEPHRRLLRLAWARRPALARLLRCAAAFLHAHTAAKTCNVSNPCQADTCTRAFCSRRGVSKCTVYRTAADRCRQRHAVTLVKPAQVPSDAAAAAALSPSPATTRTLSQVPGERSTPLLSSAMQALKWCCKGTHCAAFLCLPAGLCPHRVPALTQSQTCACSCLARRRRSGAVAGRGHAAGRIQRLCARGNGAPPRSSPLTESHPHALGAGRSNRHQQPFHASQCLRTGGAPR